MYNFASRYLGVPKNGHFPQWCNYLVLFIAGISSFGTMLCLSGAVSCSVCTLARTRVKRNLFLLALLALSILTGCMRRDLEYGNGELDIRLNIHLNIVVNGQPEQLPEPEMVRVMFFNPDTYELYTESYLPAGGGRVTLPPGRYKLLVYNFDTESTLLRGDRNYYSIEAYTNEVSSALKNSMLQAIENGISATRADGDDEEAWNLALKSISEKPVVYEPDHLFVSREDIEVLNTTESQTIEAEAETIIETWKISVSIEHPEYIASARALLTGQIGSNFIGLPKEEGKTNTDVTLIFDMAAHTDESGMSVMEAKFHTFGKNPLTENNLWLSIIIRSVSGETIVWHDNITDEYFTDDAQNEQIIQIEERIVVPEPDPSTGGGGGFQPGVDDWDQEIIPIDI